MQRFLLLACVMFTACSQTFIKDKAVRQQVSDRLEQRKDWLPAVPSEATPQEAELMQFLFAYVPVGDVADYSTELFLRNVRATILAKKEMKWNVPENIFLHFVLPIRVNNENLDTSREEFYAQLKDRVKDLPMKDAILAVNHWCHEKVTYTPSDGRTSAPMATLINAEGRCGEESTFTVAALRSVGIPARQVYTPRWAHSDDNHAWVEAWADGEWFYMGACEPEPVLNTGWFDAPAARGLLMHTKVFGDYTGDEQIISTNECYTEINVTKNYAETAQVEITVVTPDGNPVSGAGVDFGIYNYAEFFPAVRKKADANGKATLSAGLGTMIVWANDGKNYGFSRVDFGKDKSVKVVLDNKSGEFDLDIVPPAEKVVLRDITPDQRAQNAKMLAREDSIRMAYISTFANVDDARKLAHEIGADLERVTKYLIESRGNHAQISKFLTETPKEQLAVALDLLGVIAPKDLHDTPAAVLRDHLNGAFKYRNEPEFVNYILNPRVRLEFLTPYRARLSEVGGCSTPQEIIATTNNIKLVPELNPASLRITPLGLHNSRMGDQLALEVYTIALLRSKGIAARHEPLTENVQYFDKSTNKWVNATAARETVAKGTLNLVYAGDKDLKYETHFTLAKLSEGAFQTIDMETIVGRGGEMSYSTLFAKPMQLEPGTYRIVSGTRLANGSVMSAVDIFNIEKGKESVVSLTMRQDDTKIMVIGSVDPESTFIRAGKTEAGSILATTGRGYFILAILGAKQEPTNHAMRDVVAMSAYFEQWGRSMVFIFKDAAQLSKFDPKEFGTLPSNIVLGYDNNGQTTDMVGDMMKLQSTTNLPIFIIADTFGRVVFFSQGYKIGLGEQLKNVIDNL